MGGGGRGAAGGKEKDGKTVVTMDKDSLFIKLLQPGSKQPGKTREILFLKFFGGLSLFVGPLNFRTFSDVCPGFKARLDPSFACFVVCVQCIPRIHLCCDTC